MHVPPLLIDLALLSTIQLVVVLLSHRLRIPSLVGLILVGVLVGPGGLGLVDTSAEVGALAEIGLGLLLFEIGIEFSLRELRALGARALVAAILQLGLTGLAVGGVAWASGLSPRGAVVLGLVVALSSTAVGLGLLRAQGEEDAAHGRVATAILLIQDLVALAGLVWIVAEPGGRHGDSAPWLLRLAVLVVSSVISVRWFAPHLLRRVARLRDREALVATIAALVLGFMWLASWSGLSLAFGAFLAGLVVSESPYSDQVMSVAIPFRHLFASFVFLTIGMSVEPAVFVRAPAWVLGAAAAMVVAKLLLTGAAVWAAGYRGTTAALTGAVLATLGEFGFVLLAAARDGGLVPASTAGALLAGGTVTMLAAALGYPLFTRWLERRWGAGGSDAALAPARRAVSDPWNHALLLGYAYLAEQLAARFDHLQIPYLLIDDDPQIVKRQRRRGRPAIYGVPNDPRVLERVGVARARVAVVLTEDPFLSRETVAAARAANVELFVVAHTRYEREVAALREQGADLVVCDTFVIVEELLRHVLDHFVGTAEVVREEIELARAASPDPASELHLTEAG